MSQPTPPPNRIKLDITVTELEALVALTEYAADCNATTQSEAIYSHVSAVRYALSHNGLSFCASHIARTQAHA